MAIVLSFTLVIMSVITLMLGVNVIINEDINQKHNQYYVELCGASSIWTFSYACVGAIADENISAFIRCVALFGVLFVLAKGVVLISIWMNASKKWQKVIQIYVTIASLLVYPQIIDKTKIVFVDTPYGHFFTFKPYLGRMIFNGYIVTIAIICTILVVLGFRRNQRKRLHKMAGATIGCMAILTTGMIFDIVLPLFHIPSFPSSAIAQFFSVLLVYFVSIRYNVSRITIGNVSEYIYSVVDTPILVLDVEEKVQLANASASTFFNLPTDQIIGKSLSHFFFREQETVDNEKGTTVFAKCLSNGAKCDLKINDISDRYNEYLGKIVVITDMTDKIDLIEKLEESRQEAVQANQAKSAFLANMSHEIRTPMNTIVGMSELLLNKPLDEEIRQEVMSIRTAGNGLLYIINDILDISKIESGKFEIIESNYMLASMIVDVVNMMTVRLVDKGIYFLVKVDSRLPAELIGDDLRIKQILINIIGNAIKFTREGFIKVSITGHYEDNEEISMVIEVEDSGIGIKQEDMPKLFGIFNQVDTRKNRKITGTGLGLAISKDLCELMGGNIEVESEYGKGTVFTMTVKQKVKENRPVASVENKEKLLIVIYESDPIMLHYFTTTFDEMGIRYFYCASINEVKKLKNYTHFLIRNEYFAPLEDRLLSIVEKEKIVKIFSMGEELRRQHTEYRHVYLPLFCFQIINILNNEQVVYEYGKNVYDARQIKPLPFANVLIVDDNETNLHVAKGLMSSYHMKIDTAASGYEALDKVEHNEYDIIFMDHMMPELDGVDTTKQIRKMDGEYYKTVPIIALTANAMSGAREYFIAEEFNDFLAKPIEYKELNRVLREFVLPKAPANYKETLVQLAKEEEIKNARHHIAGVQMQQRIDEFGGNSELYHNVLHTYLKDIKNREIEMITLYEEKKIDEFIICVHALKSASYNVGANRFAKFSEEMEKHAKENDMEFIRKNFNDYIKGMEQLIESIGAYIKVYDREQAQKGEVPRGELSTEQLLSLKNICEEMEFTRLEQLLDHLSHFSYEKEEQELLEELTESYHDFEYDVFVSKIDEYLNRGNE